MNCVLKNELRLQERSPNRLQQLYEERILEHSKEQIATTTPERSPKRFQKKRVANNLCMHGSSNEAAHAGIRHSETGRTKLVWPVRLQQLMPEEHWPCPKAL